MKRQNTINDVRPVNEMGWFLFGNDTDWMKTLNDMQLGEYAIKKFHLENNTNYNDWYSTVSAKIGTSKLNAQISGLGLGIRFVGLSQGKVDDTMKNFADQARGRVPANVSEFRASIQDEAVKPTYVNLDFFREVVAQTVIDTTGKAINLAENITETVVDTAKETAFILKYKWYILAGVGIGSIVILKYILDNSQNVERLAKAVKPFPSLR